MCIYIYIYACAICTYSAHSRSFRKAYVCSDALVWRSFHPPITTLWLGESLPMCATLLLAGQCIEQFCIIRKSSIA